ncbi:MaoC family dehydratase N-terminal domain-containing protein [Lentzea sp. NPDC059081]|uniref:MaoC family dehydratase N-terminal domain-containing protein n=1 Tax=Lentzea sp. NPDC059081 TaxID=3346719 RepID=UPI0036856A40
MPVDADAAKAYAFAPIEVTVERGKLVFFAAATGQDDPVYRDPAAARAAGHPDVPVPPSYYFSLELSGPQPFDYLVELGVDLRHVLHGEQSFTYHRLAHAGDTLVLRPRITEVASKKGGALELLTKTTEITRDGSLVAEATAVIVVRHPVGARS